MITDTTAYNEYKHAVTAIKIGAYIFMLTGITCCVYAAGLIR